VTDFVRTASGNHRWWKKLTTGNDDEYYSLGYNKLLSR